VSWSETIADAGPSGPPATDFGLAERFARRLVAWSAWIYLFAVAILWVLLWGLADRWWLATVIQYGPRWIWALPLVVLLPAVVILRRRSTVVVLASLVIVFGPVMGFRVPLGRLLPGDSSEATVRIMSLNTGGGLDTAAFTALVAVAAPDLVAFQESPSEENLKALLGPDWHIRNDHARMGLASRFPIAEATVISRGPFGGFGPVAVRYQVAAPFGKLHLLNLHPDTPRHGLEDVLSAWWRGAESLDHNTEMRRRESEAAAQMLAEIDGPVLVAGDFNMPIESAIYRRYWSTYTNAFSTTGFGFGYSYGRTRRLRKWVRIDHILAGPGWRVRRCWVGPNVGSDHWPVLADVSIGST
jgi:endonuclease/exonuclease/phosphatase family metal-dependent hydrolase